MDVVQERLEREYNLSLLLSAPSVQYNIYLNDGTLKQIDNPALYPDPSNIKSAWEPFIKASIMVPERSGVVTGLVGTALHGTFVSAMVYLRLCMCVDPAWRKPR